MVERGSGGLGMSSGSYAQVHVGCPFYRHDDGGKVITCEALVPECDNKLRFHSRGAQRQHMALFCCKNYICCELYRALMAKYEED